MMEARPARGARNRRWMAGIPALLLAGAAVAQALPSYLTSGSLLPYVLQMPENSWLQVNTNLYSNVWTPPELVPLDGASAPTPAKIILPWSGFAWDSNRGDLILWGGGHANYPGNDVYRWHSSTLLWERGSVPSQIKTDPLLQQIAIDGVDRAPISSHTYDNNIFLPIVDRFLTWGGAAYNNGGPFIRPLESNPTGATRLTGPYLFDPDRADGNKVGGTTGSHVQRVAPHPEIVGGLMWENRDIHRWLSGQQLPGTHVQGCTGYVAEGGRDVVYVASANRSATSLNLYRYQLTTLADPAQDQITRVGAYAVGVAGQTSCGYDPVRKLFVRTGNNATPFQFWDLTAAGPFNPDKSVDGNASIGALQSWMSANGVNIQYCGFEYDPARQKFALWCGAGTIWEITPPAAGNTTSGWTATQRTVASTSVPNGDVGTGILGKWRYAPYYDVFVGLQNANEGDIWIYKPAGWVQPNPAGNALPSVAVASPSPGTSVAPATAVNISATAADADGTVARVEYYVNGSKYGPSTSAPYALSIAPTLIGDYTIVAVAVDNVGGMKVSAPVTFSVNAQALTAVLQRGLAGYNGASDTFLDATAPSVSRGGSTTLNLERVNAIPLVRFAIFQSEGGPVPDGAVIQSATLAMYKTHYDDMLRLNALRKPWAEYEASWNSASNGAPWTVPGAAGAGSDHEASADALIVPPWDPGWVQFDVTSRVMQWGSSGGNFGWRLTQTTTGGNTKYFTASEAADSTLRPKLTVVYAGGSGGGNVPPTVALTSPSANATITIGQSFTLSANAADTDGSVAKVDFYAGGALVGTDTGAPFSILWTPGATGSYALTAVATDNGNAVTTSGTVNVTVNALSNAPPTVALTSPASGAAITLGAGLTLAATAADTDGSVSKVEFFANGVLVATDTAAPYSQAWTPSSAGAYALTAVATDNALGTATSTTVNVTVNPPAGGLTVVLQRGLGGYSGAADTYLDRYLTTTVRGGSSTLNLAPATYFPLVRFAIFQAEGGPVPNGATIQSATLSLYKSYYSDTLRLNALLKPWTESGATWNQASTGQPWAAPGAAGAGTDHNAVVDAQVSPGWDPGWVNLDVTARVAQWAGSGGNHGWRMTQTTTGSNTKVFNASETGDGTLRPKLTVVYAGGSGNVPPTVSLTSPSASASITLGASFTLAATANDADGTVGRVDFYANGQLAGFDTTAPYTLDWTPSAAGNYVLTAVATDSSFASTTSASVPVTVGAPANLPPSVALMSPAANATIAFGQSFTLTASASDSDGTVGKVDFYANGALVGTDASAPFSLAWTPSAPGSYLLTAIATDNALAAGTSAPVAVTVTAVPGGATIVLQRGLDGYAGASDTYLDRYLATTVRGTSGTMNLAPSTYVPLVRFAIFQAEGGPVPNGATIHSATLSLYKGYYNDTLRLNAMLKPWVETAATWNTASPGVAWTSPGAAGVGTDHSSSVDALVGSDWNPGWVAFDVTARVQQWAGSGGNHGWRLSQTSVGSNTKYFNASEYGADATVRPKLTIRFE